MKREVELNWIRFSRWGDVLNDKDGKYEFPCVYVLAEKDGPPFTEVKLPLNGETRETLFGLEG